MLISKVGRRQWKIRGILIGIIIFLCIGVILHLFPFYWVVATSISSPTEVYKIPPNLFPSNPNFLVYKVIFSSFKLFMPFSFYVYLKNSFIITGGILLIQIPLMALVAYALSKLIAPTWNRVVFLFFIGTMFFPVALTLIPQYLLLSNFPFITKIAPNIPFTNNPFPTHSFIDSSWAVILPATFNAFSILLFKGFFDTLPNEVINAARIDGASEISIFRRIILPMSKPVFAVVSYFTFTGSWNAFMWPLIVLKRGSSAPLSLMLYFFQARIEADFRETGVGLSSHIVSKEAVEAGYGYTALMAVSIIEAIPIFIAFIIFREQIMKGIRLRGFK